MNDTIVAPTPTGASGVEPLGVNSPMVKWKKSQPVELSSTQRKSSMTRRLLAGAAFGAEPESTDDAEQSETDARYQIGCSAPRSVEGDPTRNTRPLMDAEKNTDLILKDGTRFANTL